MRALIAHKLLRNTAALFSVQFSNYALQLLTVPYLARVLGPRGWGLLAIAQAFAQYASFLIDYGFDFSATRETARLRNEPGKIGDLFAGVLGARIILTCLVVVAALLVRTFVPTLGNDSRLLWTALAWGITVGFTPNWYFQGVENMGRIAALDVGGKVISSLGIVLFVRAPGDGWKMLAIQAVVCAVAIVVNMQQVYRQIPFRVPTIRLTLDVLRMGKTMFLYRSSTVLNSVSNAFVLGLFAIPQIVGFYSGAERIMKAFIFAIWPINQAFYPLLSRLHHEGDMESSRMARLSAMAMGGAGLVFGVTAFAFAPALVHVLLGKAFLPSVVILRILALVIPFTAINFFLGLQCMLPLGMDKAFNWITSGSAVLNLVLALLLARRYSQVGVASAVVMAQVFATVCFIVCLWRKRRLTPARQNALALPEQEDLALSEAGGGKQEVYS